MESYAILGEFAQCFYVFMISFVWITMRFSRFLLFILVEIRLNHVFRTIYIFQLVFRMFFFLQVGLVSDYDLLALDSVSGKSINEILIFCSSPIALIVFVLLYLVLLRTFHGRFLSSYYFFVMTCVNAWNRINLL